MTAAPVVHPDQVQRQNWYAELTEPRIGVMLHYDASATDAGSVAWLAGADIKVSYNWIVLDSGNVIPIAPETAAAWHAGKCRSPDPRLKYTAANHAFYGVSIAATTGDVATVEAKRSVAALCRTYFLRHGWPLAEVWRIVSHRAHAWPWAVLDAAGREIKPGRKNDPEGADLSRPVMNTNEIRGMVAAMGAGAA